MGAESVAEMDESFVDAQQVNQVAALGGAPSETSSESSEDLTSTESLSSKGAIDVDSSALQIVSAKEDVSDMKNGPSIAAESSISSNVDTDPEMDPGMNNPSDVAQGQALAETGEVKKDVNQEEEDSVWKYDTREDGKKNVTQASEIVEEEAMEEFSLQQDSNLEDGKKTVTQVSEIVEDEAMEEITLEQDSRPEASVFTGVPKPGPQSVSEIVEEEAMEEISLEQDSNQGDGKKNVTQVSEIVQEEAMEEISLEQECNPEASVVTGVPNPGPQSSTIDANLERRSQDENKPSVSAGTPESPIAERYAGGSGRQEGQESEQATTSPASERVGAVIRLTRQMSRVLSSMAPMSTRYEIREAKELQELQDKVRFLEEELKVKASDYSNLASSLKEKESQLMNKIECLELANEQLLQGGKDSSIQLQMELTRLQRQNSVLSLRERELQFQISTQEMLSAQMLDKKPDDAHTTTTGTAQLESKIAVLESKLAEAVEVSNMYKIQLHEAFNKQKSAQSAALLNLGDGDEMVKELQKLRKQTKEQEAELQDLQDRFFLVSVRLAESVAQREELLMKMKRIQYQKQ